MRKNKQWLNYQLTATFEGDRYDVRGKCSVNGSRHRTVSELKILGKCMPKLCLQIVCWLLSVEHAFQRWNTVKVLFKNNAENKAGKLVPDLFVFWKALYEVKVSDQHLNFNILC